MPPQGNDLLPPALNRTDMMQLSRGFWEDVEYHLSSVYAGEHALIDSSMGHILTYSCYQNTLCACKMLSYRL